MPPPGSALSAMHLLRRAHPLRLRMRSEVARIDRADPDVIRRFQERRLRALIRWAAARSPFYRSWFAESGVDHRSIRTIEDLQQLPILDRAQLVDQADRFRAYPRRLLWPANSSGTSGKVVTTFRTVGSSVYELTVLERQWSWFGLPPGSRRVVLRGSDFHADRPETVTRGVPGGNLLLVSSFHLTPARLPEIVTAIRAFEPDAIEGWPSSISLLAGLLHAVDERLPVRAVITSSEVISDRQLDLMRQVFSGPIVDHYGQTERVAMAGTCEANGYHTFPDYGIVEVIPASDQSWEIIGTPLHNWGFPLFRYRTGDAVGPAPDGDCPCGRRFPRLGRIDGRVEDSFTAGDGRQIPLPHALIKNLVGLSEVQIAQRAPGRFEIRLVPGVGYDADTVQALALRNIERMIGPGQVVTFEQMDTIPRSASGKLRTAVVVDDLAT